MAPIHRCNVRAVLSLTAALLHVSQEGVVDAVHGRGSLRRVEGQHRHQPVGEGWGAGVRTGLWRHFTFGLALLPLVLLGEHVIKRPRLQLGDVPQLARLPEVFLGVLPCTQGDIILGFSNRKEWRAVEALLRRIVNISNPQIT